MYFKVLCSFFDLLVCFLLIEFHELFLYFLKFNYLCFSFGVRIDLCKPFWGVFLGGLVVISPPARQKSWVWSLVWKDTQKEMATHCSIPAWEFPQSEGGAWWAKVYGIRVRHNLVTKEQQDFHLFDLLWGQR